MWVVEQPLRSLMIRSLGDTQFAMLFSCLSALGWQLPPLLPPARHHPRRAACARATAAAEPEASVALAFGQALSQAWLNDKALLLQLLSDDVVVETPIWQCEGRDAYMESLGEAAEFFARAHPPTLQVLSQRQLGPGRASVEWVLGVEWPSLWSARVNLLGESVVRYDAGGANGERALVREVRETWHQTPREAFFRQVVPRRRDWMSLWNAPTAEHVPQKCLQKCDGYDLRQLPPMLAVQAETIEVGETIFEEQAPLAPAFAFPGQVKRREWFSTVSPGILERSFTTFSLPGGMEQPAQRRRWILPLPLRFGTDADALPSPDGGLDDEDAYYPGIVHKSIQYVRRPAQRLAVGRVRGMPSNEAVLTVVKKVADAARRDGQRVLTQEGRPVFVHMCYDLKNGFNERGQMSMAIWIAAPDFLQENEVGVVLETDEAAE